MLIFNILRGGLDFLNLFMNNKVINLYNSQNIELLFWAVKEGCSQSILSIAMTQI